MSNKETLQNYNERLGTNNITLDSILATINSLPEAGSSEIVKPLYLVVNGIEQEDVTGGSTFVQHAGTEGLLTQGDNYISMCVGLWSHSQYIFNNKFDFDKYKKVCIDCAFPNTNNTGTNAQYLAIAIGLTDTSGTGTQYMIGNSKFTRTVIEIPITDNTGENELKVMAMNLVSSSYTSYPFYIYNMWLEGEIPFNLQDKSIEITENGTTTVTADTDYEGLNSVEVITNVPGEVSKIVWTNPEPDSAFEAQDITLSGDDIDCVEIIYELNYNDATPCYETTGKIPIGGNCRYVNLLSGSYVYRTITGISKDSMTFTTCSVAGTGTSDDYLVPLFVIGYNTGLFS